MSEPQYLPTRPGTQVQWVTGPNRGARAWLRHQLRHRRGAWSLGCGYCQCPVAITSYVGDQL